VAIARVIFLIYFSRIFQKSSKKAGGTRTWGLTSEKTRVDDYEEMMNRGWRRCGSYYYKTDLQGSCCQLYTIRLKAAEFKISQKQKKIMNKFNRFLNGELEHLLLGIDEKKAKKEEEKKIEMTPLEKYENMMNDIVKKAILLILMQDAKNLNLATDLAFSDVSNQILTKQPKKATHGDISTNAAIVLFHANRKKMKEKNEAKISELQKAIISRIEKSCTENKFKVVPVESGFINFIAEFNFKEIIIESSKLSEKPKHVEKPKQVEKLKEEKKEEKMIEEDKKSEIPKTQYSAYFKEYVPNINPNPKHKYTVEIVPAIGTEESFEIFKNYQAEIHKEPGKKMTDFTHFLCDSPLYDQKNQDDVKRKIPINDTGKTIINQGVWPRFLGSYHMYHRIDGKLIAVGILDFTPTVLSSVYFMYDPKYKFLNLGIVGAIREIEYVNKIRENYSKEFEYYYMGYYIQDCVKSVYKGEYEPSELLCPETYTWVPLEKARPIIAINGFCRLADSSVPINPDMAFTAAEIKKEMKETKIFTDNDIIPMIGVIKKLQVIFQIIIQKLGKKVLPHLVWTD